MGLVTLVSGGLDSTLMSLLARKDGVTLYPLFIDYGQLCAVREWRACKSVHARHKLPTPRRMDLRGFGKVIRSGLTDRRLRINEDAFLPGRNMLFVLAGASYAHQIGASGVAIGLLSDEQRIFPDQTQAFLKSCEAAIAVAMGRGIKIVAPLMSFTKRDVLSLARKEILGGTYSCHAGGPKPCGRCVSCAEVKRALQPEV